MFTRAAVLAAETISIIFEQLLKTKLSKRKGNLYYGHGNQQQSYWHT